MGNKFLHLSDAVTVIASENTWIEGQAIQQLETTSRLAGMRRVVGLPDLHPGRGYPVGAAFFSVGRFYPALVGNDIGCGMALWQTDLPLAKFNLDKLERRLGNIDHPLDESWQPRLETYGLSATGFEASLGTIGGGNHFAEVQQLESFQDEAACQALGLKKKHLLLLVHSGSRGLGQDILSDHVARFGHRGLEEGSPEAVEYLERHGKALAFAAANRELIALRILDRLGTEGRCLTDVHHNLVEARQVDGVAGWLHRKGATPGDGGVVVIPGSRGDYSYLVETIGSPASLYSLAHGAGRKWMRSECRDRLGRRFTQEQLQKTALGSRVVCRDRQLIYEEAPEAYKSIDSVIQALLEAGLIRLLARLKPVLTYKTSGEGGR